jgi:hypothetical protein
MPTPTPAPISNGKCGKFADENVLCAQAACTSKVKIKDFQPDYQCAEFVARSIASGGYIPNLSPSAAKSAYYSYSYNGKKYNLCWTSSKAGGGISGLEDLLIALKWKSGGKVDDCSVVFTNGSKGAWMHVVVGVGPDIVDSHNNARYHSPVTQYTVNAVYNNK